MDETENVRRQMVGQINGQVVTDDNESERKRLESVHGKVWDTQQLGDDFEVLGFMAPCVVVRRKSDKKKGSLFFQHNPRFYFDFKED